MSKTITLAYEVSVGLQNPASMISRVAAIEVSQELEFLNMNKVTDDTVAGTGKVTRTIGLETTDEAEAMFPTDAELIAATRELLSGVINLQFPGKVTAAEPVVS